MKGYLSLMEEGAFGKIPKKLQHPLKQIDDSNGQLITLLNNLLQIARAEAHSIELKTTSTNICDIVQDVIEDVQALADQKKLKFYHTCSNKAVQVMADKERLREIINNLLSNAIKYSTQAGKVEITHEIMQDKLITHIKDNGVGIPKKDQDKIFSRFFRVEQEAAKGIPGTGLGLFIVKQLIEKMGGRIWFESVLAQGSTFSFSLPLTKTYSLKRT